jgi:hypothetical protein
MFVQCWILLLGFGLIETALLPPHATSLRVNLMPLLKSFAAVVMQPHLLALKFSFMEVSREVILIVSETFMGCYGFGDLLYGLTHTLIPVENYNLYQYLSCVMCYSQSCLLFLWLTGTNLIYIEFV